MFVREKEKMKNQYYWLWISVGVGLLSIFSFYPLVILKIFSLFICMLLGKVAPLKTFCFWDSLLSQKLWPRLLHEFHGKLLKGMITWAIRENIRNPMPDYSSSPLETLNNIWDINPNDKGSNDNQSAWPSNVDRESSYCLKWCPWSPLSEQEDPKSFKAESYPLSGMAETDKALHSLFDLIEKIYVRTWYNKFSANQCVPRKLRWDQFCLVKHQSVL